MTRSPHVLLVHDAYGDYAVCLANALSRHTRVTVLHSTKMHAATAHLLECKVSSVTYPHRRVRNPRRIFTLPHVDDVAIAIGADLVHFQQSNDPLFHIVQLGVRRRVPRVLTIHDLSPHPGDRSHVPGGHVTLRAQRQRFDQYIVHYPQMSADLAHRWRLSTERVSIVPHGELGELYRRQSAPRAHVPVSASHGQRILFFGRIWPYKGLDRLIRALNRLAKHRQGLTLTIAGTGESLRAYLAEVEPPLAVEVHDRFIPNSEIVSLFSRATAVCLPYLEASQSGVHALACGLGVPVVASNIGGLGAAIAHEDDGLLVPPDDIPALADALARVLDDPVLQARLTAGARSRAESELSWEVIAGQTMDVYRRVLGSG